MEDHKLLQTLYLVARQPCRAPITLYILFNKRGRLENKGLVNLLGIWARTRFDSQYALHYVINYPKDSRHVHCCL